MPSSPCAAAAASARAPSSSASSAPKAVVAALLILLTGCAHGRSAGATIPQGGALDANAVVAKVVDGDTIDVTADGGTSTTRIRMIGFNTPESVDPRKPVECFGKEASKHLMALSPVGTAVRLEHDVERHDRYGRTLAYVYRAADGLFLNLQMVADGYAHTLSIAPNVAFADRFLDAERAARAAGLGLWTACRG